MESMKRRAFLAGMAAAVAAAPFTEAQQPARPYRIGYISPGSPDATTVSPVDGVRAGLRDQGFVEGRDFTLDLRYADSRGPMRVHELATEVVRSNVDAIVTVTTMVALEVKKTTSTIPIVMAVSTDPVSGGVVESLPRPGGNITGMTLAGPELTGKRMEMLKAVAPHATRLVIAVPGTLEVYDLYRREAVVAGPRLGFADVSVVNIGTDPAKWDDALAVVGRIRGTALLVTESSAFALHRARIAEVTARHRLPAIYGFTPHVEAGGLASYGPDLAHLYRRAGAILGKVLRGTRPADIPVEQPAKYQFTINLKTANALGLTIPPSLLLRADQVIE